MMIVTGNFVLDQMIAAYKLMHPGSAYVKLLQVDSSNIATDVDLTPEWWNSYDGYLKLVFENKGGDEKTVLTKRFTPWKDTNESR